MNIPTNIPIDYLQFRCIDPVAEIMKSPFYRIEDVCPCNPKYSGITGRGYTSCPLGIQPNLNIINKEYKEKNLLMNIKSTNGITYNAVPNTIKTTGSYFPLSQVTPPQQQPYPLTRVGYTWRNPY